MHHSVLAVPLAVFALLMSSCAGVPQSEAPPSAITLVAAPEPATLAVIIQNHPDARGSQERQIFFAAELQRKTHALTVALQPQSFLPGATLTEAVAAALKKPDRTVVRAANPRSGREEFLMDYAATGAKPGIVVDVVPRAIGYWAESLTGAYHPWVVIAFRVFDTAAGKTLASGQIGTGPPLPGETAIVVAPDAAYAFTSLDAVVADPARAVAGLRTAIQQVARALAERTQQADSSRH